MTKKTQTIVLVTGAFPSVSETFIVNKFIGLIESGLNVHVICSSFEQKKLERYPKLAPYIHRIHQTWPTQKWLVPFLFPILCLISLLNNFSITRKYFSAGLTVRNLKRFYQDAVIVLLKADILHFEFGALAIGREYLKELLNCKMVVSFRGYDLNFSGLEDPHYYDEVWKAADAVHCLGEDLWRRAQARGCPWDKPHFLIPPAIDTESFKPANGARHPSQGCLAPLKILSVGRLEWKKGYEFALQAVKMLKDKGLKIEYRIIGSGNYLEAIAFCRHQLGLEQEVQLLGTKSQREIIEEMRQADLFLHAAVSEGFCNAVLEAQAMVLPVVCSDAGGLSENVVNSVTGFVVPRRDPKALAEKILELANNSELRQRMGQAGRERVVKHFQIDNQIKAFSDLYKGLAH